MRSIFSIGSRNLSSEGLTANSESPWNCWISFAQKIQQIAAERRKLFTFITRAELLAVRW